MRKAPQKDDRRKEKGDCKAQKENQNGIKAGVTKQPPHKIFLPV